MLGERKRGQLLNYRYENSVPGKPARDIYIKNGQKILIKYKRTE